MNRCSDIRNPFLKEAAEWVGCDAALGADLLRASLQDAYAEAGAKLSALGARLETARQSAVQWNLEWNRRTAGTTAVKPANLGAAALLTFPFSLFGCAEYDPLTHQVPELPETPPPAAPEILPTLWGDPESQAIERFYAETGGTSAFNAVACLNLEGRPASCVLAGYQYSLDDNMFSALQEDGRTREQPSGQRGNDRATAVVWDGEGNFYLGGYSVNQPYIRKMSGMRSLNEWTLPVEPQTKTRIASMALDGNRLHLAGYTVDASEKPKLWQAAVGTDGNPVAGSESVGMPGGMTEGAIRKVKWAADGSLLLTGYTGHGVRQIFVAKTVNGQVEWIYPRAGEKFATPSTEWETEGMTLVENSKGEIIVGGRMGESGLLLKLSAQGALLGKQELASEIAGEPVLGGLVNDIQLSPEGDVYYVAGHVRMADGEPNRPFLASFSDAPAYLHPRQIYSFLPHANDSRSATITGLAVLKTATGAELRFVGFSDRPDAGFWGGIPMVY